MTSDDAILGIDQDGIGETEFTDGCRDLGNLLIRMRPAVACVGDQFFNWCGFNFPEKVKRLFDFDSCGLIGMRRNSDRHWRLEICYPGEW